MAPIKHRVEEERGRSEGPSRAHPGILRRDEADTLVRWWAEDVDDLPDWDRHLFGAYRRANQQPTKGAMRMRSVERRRTASDSPAL